MSRVQLSRLVAIPLVVAALLTACGDEEVTYLECEPGDERTVACGFNGRGQRHEVCPWKGWWPNPEREGAPRCEDLDECADGDERMGPGDESDLVTRAERCEAGAWTPNGPPAPVGLEAGGHHTCAARLDGSMLCWGRNSEAQLTIQGPQGDLFDRTSPVYIRADSVADVVAVSAGLYHTCALRRLMGDYTRVLCWGRNYQGQVGNGPPGERVYEPAHVGGLPGGVVSLSAGYHHTCAVLGSGRVRCWGSAFEGTLGEGSVEGAEPAPVEVSGLEDAVAVSAGSGFSCALRAGGQIACWGASAHGQLGHGESGEGAYEATPVEVAGITEARAVSVGNLHACAQLASGEVACWGRAHEGELGNGEIGLLPSPTPVSVTGIENAVAIAAGDSFSCAALASGEVACWGRGMEGQLGKVGEEAESSRIPVLVPGVEDAVGITAGQRHACALRASGELLCWGANEAGQLGVGERGEPAAPAPVTLPPALEPF